MKSKYLVPAIFIAVLALSRVPGLLPLDFSPVYAFMFCAGAFFTGSLAWWLPLATMLGTDLALNCYYSQKFPDSHVWSGANLANLGFNYVAYIVMLLLGRGFGARASWLKLVGGGLVGAMLFYLLTNTAA